MGVKFCTAPAMLLAPREVCASAVNAADPANASASARVSVILRIDFSLRLLRCAPLAVLETSASYPAGSVGPRGVSGRAHAQSAVCGFTREPGSAGEEQARAG